MKKIVLVSSVAVLSSFLAMTASADYAPVVIDTDTVINLEYDKTIDLTGSVNVPTVNMDGVEADISVNQFNHDSPVSAVGSVTNNMSGAGDGITDLHVDVTAVGNNASIDLNANDTVIGVVQGNQNGGANAVGNISGNTINLDTVTNADGEEIEGIVELNVTAVGNNLTIKSADDYGVNGTQIGTVQFNYDSPVTAVGSISGNGFGVNPIRRDPSLAVTAVGNNLTAPLGTTGSILQENVNSPISAFGFVSGNVGDIGPVTVSVSAVGNNISIKAPTE